MPSWTASRRALRVSRLPISSIPSKSMKACPVWSIRPKRESSKRQPFSDLNAFVDGVSESAAGFQAADLIYPVQEHEGLSRVEHTSEKGVLETRMLLAISTELGSNGAGEKEFEQAIPEQARLGESGKTGAKAELAEDERHRYQRRVHVAGQRVA